MVELLALTLSLFSPLLSEAEEVYPKEALLGLGGRKCFRPRHRMGCEEDKGATGIEPVTDRG